MVALATLRLKAFFFRNFFFFSTRSNARSRPPTQSKRSHAMTDATGLRGRRCRNAFGFLLLLLLPAFSRYTFTHVSVAPSFALFSYYHFSWSARARRRVMRPAAAGWFVGKRMTSRPGRGRRWNNWNCCLKNWHSRQQCTNEWLPSQFYIIWQLHKNWLGNSLFQEKKKKKINK